MPSGNKVKKSGNSVSERHSRNSRSASGTKKKTKLRIKKKPLKEQANIRCVSPLVYNPEEALQELMQKYLKVPEDTGLNELREFENNRQKNQKLTVRMGLSNHISRFEIPMDIKVLENMTVLEYLRNYCCVCKRRQVHYKKFFDVFDKDKDGALSSKEVMQALKEVYFNEINPIQVDELMTMISAEENTAFDAKLFFSLCALSERLFYTTFVTEDTTDRYSEKHLVETADFSAINWKCNGYKISKALKRLLHFLVNKPESY